MASFTDAELIAKAVAKAGCDQPAYHALVSRAQSGAAVTICFPWHTITIDVPYQADPPLRASVSSAANETAKQDVQPPKVTSKKKGGA